MLDKHRLPQQSELFTVRLWPEDLGAGHIEWRGRVQHVLSGHTGYFREWSGLIAFLTELLATKTPLPSPEAET